MLPNISWSKANETFKLSQLIEYNNRILKTYAGNEARG